MHQGCQVRSGMLVMVDAQLDLEPVEYCEFAAVGEIIEPFCEGSSGCVGELILIRPWMPVWRKACSDGCNAQVSVWCSFCMHAASNRIAT